MTESINKDYWDDYYSFWDRFVGNWFKEREQGFETPQDKDSKAFCHAVKGLVLDELPNPYFGDPKNGVDAVIINLNPGGSEKDKDKKSTDAAQCYSNLGKTDEHGNCIGWLMKKFVDDAECSYKWFVGNDDENVNWSQLNPDLRWHKPEVCGVKWWQGLLKNEKEGEEPYSYEGKTKTRKVIHSSSQRIEWMRRIYNNPWLDPAKVFALELCPYHSKNFDFDSKKLNDGERKHVFNFIADHVIHPALMTVAERNLDFAVAIGKTTAIYLEQQLKKIKGGEKYGIEARLEKEWWDGSDGIKEWGWPTAIDQKTHVERFTYRKYCLFALKDKDGRLARFLVCAAKGPGANSVPGKEFEENIEKKLIREYVRTNPLTKESYERIQPSEKMRWWRKSRETRQPVNKTKVF